MTLAALAIGPAPPAPPPAGTGGATAAAIVGFAPAIANVEFLRRTMVLAPPRDGLTLPRVTGTAWYGQIVRRLEGDLATAGTDHFVPFVVEYSGGVATRAWCDLDLDDDLTNDPPLALSPHPLAAGARSFLAPLRWTARDGGRPVPVERTIRVILEPTGAAFGSPPCFRLQSVFARVGTVSLDGGRHHAFLFDGDGDGLYRARLGDGLYVDLDDDGAIAVDPMGDEFGPFGAPFTLGRRAYLVTNVAPDGASIALRSLGPAVPRPPAPAIGSMAPDFTFTSTDGRVERLSEHRGRPVLIYFWVSTCRTCRHQADRLTRLYERLRPQGIEILAISFDTDRAALDQFRAAHRQTWPTSFSGRALWEDPIGWLYRERGTGLFYRVDPGGRLAEITADLGTIEAALDLGGGAFAGLQ